MCVKILSILKKKKSNYIIYYISFSKFILYTSIFMKNNKLLLKDFASLILLKGIILFFVVILSPQLKLVLI